MLTRREILTGLAAATALRAAPSVERLRAGKSTIEIVIADGPVDVGRPAVIAWIDKAVRAVESYYGRFPVPEARVEVQPVEGRQSVRDDVAGPRGAVEADRGCRDTPDPCTSRSTRARGRSRTLRSPGLNRAPVPGFRHRPP